MSNLTRIKNNQVTNSTLVASAKLVPGSITGGLFSDPISYSGNMTIVGNLTVQGTTTVVDTTNTLIADPVLVLSRGETGAPSNDSGILVERGSSDNAAFLWDETNDRFQAITTVADGSSGGSVTVADFSDIKMRDAILTGGDIISTATTVNVFNTTATTVNFAGAATTTEIGATTGNTIINNNLIVDLDINTTAATVNLANANTTTINFGSAATTLNIGNAAGNVVIAGDLQISGNTLYSSSGSAVATLSNADLTVHGNLTVQGFTTSIGSQDLVVEDSIINLHTSPNLAALVADDGRDVGIKFHYYKSSDKNAFLGWSNSSSELEYFVDATESAGGVISGTYGNIKASVFRSIATTGTAPMIIASTTQVTNLNSDFAGTLINGTSNVDIATANGNVTVAVGGVANIATFTASSAVVNSSGVNTEFLVYANSSVTANPIIYTSPSSAKVGILTSTPNANATVHINSTDSMIIPTGTTAQRPSGASLAAGMVRFNTSTGFMEFYSGGAWESTSGSFTVINYNNFAGDGSTVAFTMTGSSTTAATLVSINGVLQQPSTAYSVSGTGLTFTEAPLSGDDIDVRLLTTTTTVTSLAEGDSSLVLSDSGTGTVTFTLDGTARWLTTGNIIRPNANNTISLGTASFQWADVNAVAININGVPAASTDDATALAIALG